MALHADQLQLSRRCAASFRSGNETGLLADAVIAANNTNQATLRAAVGNESNFHAEILNNRGRQQRALDYDGSTFGIADITDSNLPSTTTNAALIALTQGVGDNARLLILE